MYVIIAYRNKDFDYIIINFNIINYLIANFIYDVQNLKI